MRVFKLTHDNERYQYFLGSDGCVDPFGTLEGYSVKDDWSPPAVRIPKPELEPGNFFNFGNGYLIADSRATEAVMACIEPSGELLPLPYAGQTYTVFNCTVCPDCLDHKKTTWRDPEGDCPASIDRYVFRCGLIPMQPIFKIPEEDKIALFFTLGQLDPHGYDLREMIRREGLKGLILTEVWRDESETADA